MKKCKSIFTCLLVLLSLINGTTLIGQDSATQVIPTRLDTKIYNVEEINTEGIEFSPAYYLGGIVYATSKVNTSQVDRNINESFFELFYAEENFKGIPDDPKRFSLKLSSKFHEGPVTFNSNWSKIFFTRNNILNGLRKSDRKGVTRLKIFEANRGYEDWEEINELPFNSDNYSTCHPSVNEKGDIIFFASDMPGGIGGMDLYYSRNINGTWQLPVNLGDEINTPGHEVFPYIHESGILFFSSSGHKGAGGLDIFYGLLNDGSWGEVNNLGEPFNSAQDDLGIILNQGGTEGYFTSSRYGGLGKDDIYKFNLSGGINKLIGVKESVKAIVTVLDKNSNQVIPDALVEVKSINGSTSSDPDQFDVEYFQTKGASDEVYIKLKRKGINSLNSLFTNEIGFATIGLEEGGEYIVSVSKEGYQSIDQVYKMSENKGSLVLPIYLEKDVCFNVSGSIFDENNVAVKNAIVRFGDSCDSTEIMLRTDSLGNYATCLPCGCQYTVIVEKEGRKIKQRKIEDTDCSKQYVLDFNFTNPTSVKSEPTKPSIPSTEDSYSNLSAGNSIILENIYFKYNQAKFKYPTVPSLDDLSKYLIANPTIKVELSSHTDARGSSRYNMKLSQKRAEAAKSYLVKRGVSTRQIHSVGMGETLLLNHCTEKSNCSEAEHEVNRRLEVKVVE